MEKNVGSSSLVKTRVKSGTKHYRNHYLSNSLLRFAITMVLKLDGCARWNESIYFYIRWDCKCCRSKLLPLTHKITDFTYALIFELPAGIYILQNTMVGGDGWLGKKWKWRVREKKLKKGKKKGGKREEKYMKKAPPPPLNHPAAYLFVGSYIKKRGKRP